MKPMSKISPKSDQIKNVQESVVPQELLDAYINRVPSACVRQINCIDCQLNGTCQCHNCVLRENGSPFCADMICPNKQSFFWKKRT